MSNLRSLSCSFAVVVVFPCRTQAAIAGAVTMLRCLPEKLNPVIKPLMESIKKEDDEQLQVCCDIDTIMSAVRP